jgi:hypothetical protein
MIMFRFYLRLTIVLLPLFVVFALTMSAIGSIRPIHPSLRGFVEDCEGIPQPCWYGVVISSATTINQLEAALLNRGYFPVNDVFQAPVSHRNYLFLAGSGCNVLVYYSSDSMTLLEMVLQHCEDLSLADMLDVFHAPTSIQLYEWGEGSLFYDDLAVYVGFFDGLWSGTHIDKIVVNRVRASETPAFAWQGYAPHWRYCELELEIEYCF